MGLGTLYTFRLSETSCCRVAKFLASVALVWDGGCSCCLYNYPDAGYVRDVVDLVNVTGFSEVYPYQWHRFTVDFVS